MALTVTLILLGTAAAAAYWTASASLDGSAAAASVGLTQTEPLELATTYDAGTLHAADTVTITNTGAREATVQTTVSAPQSQALGKAVEVHVAEVDAAESCTPGAQLESAVTGHAGLTYTPEEKLPAGQSILVCVQTSLTPQQLFSLPAGSTQVSVTSSLTYAPGAEWTRASTAEARQGLATDRASGAPQTTCSKATHVFSDDELTFRLAQGLASGTTGVGVFIVKGGQISELAASEYTVNSAAGTVRLTEETMLKHRQGLGPAQVVISYSTADGTRTIAGVGRIQFTSPFGWDWLPEASCR